MQGWQLNEFRVESAGLGAVEVVVPGSEIAHRKDMATVANGKRFALDAGFWDRLSGAAQLTMVSAGKVTSIGGQ